MKKHISNNIIALIAIFFTLMSLFMNWYVVHKVQITGKAVAPSVQLIAEVRLCYNAKPNITNDCSNTAYVNDSYSCYVDYYDLDENQSWEFSDNATFFNINQTSGLINFVPNPSLIGIYDIIITLDDNAGCNNSIDYETFTLEIKNPACNDSVQNQNETGIDCGGPCPTCPSIVVGGGGGEVAAAKCVPRWACSSWRKCVYGKVSRDCNDIKCGLGNKTEEKECIVNFAIEPPIFKIALKIGETFKDAFKVTNIGDADIDIIMSTYNLGDIANLSIEKITLPIGTDYIVGVIFKAEVGDEGIHAGKIRAQSGLIFKSIITIVEIESIKALFDISLDIPSEYSRVYPGEEIVASITLFNLYDIGYSNVTLKYIIKDFEGNIILTKEEIIGVKKQATFERKFKIPENTIPGEYVLGVEVRYNNLFSTASEIFTVKEKIEKPAPAFNYLLVIIITILVLVFVILLYQHKHFKRLHHVIKKKIPYPAMQKHYIDEDEKEFSVLLRERLKLEKERIKLKRAEQTQQKYYNFLYSIGILKTKEEIERIRREREQKKLEKEAKRKDKEQKKLEIDKFARQNAIMKLKELHRQLEVLKKGYDNSFISAESYRKGKERIIKEINKDKIIMKIYEENKLIR